MNEIAAATSLNLAWVFGILFTIGSVLVGVIWRHEQQKHRRHEERISHLERSFVSKETLERVERTFRDAIDTMNDQRREMHQENKEAWQEIKDNIADVRVHIDNEFRELRKIQRH